MTPSIMTSSRARFFNSKRYTRYIIYTVTVEDFDGEEMTFEVNCESEKEAAEKAIRLAASHGMYNIYNTYIA